MDFQIDAKKGRSLIASSDIKSGSLLLTEHSLIATSSLDSLVTLVLDPKIKAKLASPISSSPLPSNIPQSYLKSGLDAISSFTYNNIPALKNKSPLYLQISSNTFNVNIIKTSKTNQIETCLYKVAVFPITALINHACLPNCFVNFKKSTAPGQNSIRVEVRALRDINVGDEITISYGPLANVSGVEDRRKVCLEKWGFSCLCYICGDGDGDLDVCKSWGGVLCQGCGNEIFLNEYVLKKEVSVVRCVKCTEVLKVEIIMRLKDRVSNELEGIQNLINEIENDHLRFSKIEFNQLILKIETCFDKCWQTIDMILGTGNKLRGRYFDLKAFFYANICQKYELSAIFSLKNLEFLERKLDLELLREYGKTAFLLAKIGKKDEAIAVANRGIERFIRYFGKEYVDSFSCKEKFQKSRNDQEEVEIDNFENDLIELIRIINS